MKHILFSVIFLMIAIITFFFSIIVFMLGASNLRMPSYYANKNNYEELGGRIEEMVYSETNGDLLIVLDEQSKSYDGRFRIIQANEKILKENGFLEDFKEGDTITIVSASGYFGDGYRVPIVGVKTDTKEYLNVDTGITNQVEDCKHGRNELLGLLLPSMSLSGISFVLFIYLLVRKNKTKVD